MYNAPPEVADLPTWEVTEGTDAELDLSPYITDPNDLELTVQCSDREATVEGLVLKLRHDVAVPDRTVTLTVSDGENATEAELAIHVVNVNDLPVIGEVLPLHGSEFKKGRRITFSVVTSDEDGDTLTITWKDGEKVLGTGSPFEYSKLKAGKRTITVVVDDGTGQVEDSFIVTVKEDKKVPGPGPFMALAALVMAGLALCRGRRQRP